MSFSDAVGRAPRHPLRSELQFAATALQVWTRVLGALFYREAEMRRGKAFALGFVAAGLEPLIIIAAIGTLFTVIGRAAPYGSNLLLFIGTGVFPIYLFIHTSMRIREPLGWRFGRYPVETSLDHVLVHALLHCLSSSAIAVLYFGGLYLFGVREAMPFDLFRAIEALAAIFLFGVAMGIVNSVVARLIPFWNTLWPGLARAALHFSAPYFVADYLSPNIRRWFALNPILHGVNWFRHAFYPMYPNIIDSHEYILLGGLIALTLGLVLERVFRRTMDEEG